MNHEPECPEIKLSPFTFLQCIIYIISTLPPGLPTNPLQFQQILWWHYILRLVLILLSWQLCNIKCLKLVLWQLTKQFVKMLQRWTTEEMLSLMVSKKGNATSDWSSFSTDGWLMVDWMFYCQAPFSNYPSPLSKWVSNSTRSAPDITSLNFLNISKSSVFLFLFFFF